MFTTSATRAPATILAGPVSGVAAAPTFRALAATDLPTTITSTTTGSAAKLTTPVVVTLSGDIGGSFTFDGSASAVSSTTTLATISPALPLTAFNTATVHSPLTLDAKGRVIAVGAAVTITPAWASITGVPTSFAPSAHDHVSITGSAATVSGSLQNSITSTPNLATIGTLTAGTWNAATISLAYGGTGANLSTGGNGSVVYLGATNLGAAAIVGIPKYSANTAPVAVTAADLVAIIGTTPVTNASYATNTSYVTFAYTKVVAATGGSSGPAVRGTHYSIDTTAGPYTLTLPTTTPVTALVGYEIEIDDFAGNFRNNNLTIVGGPTGAIANIEGSATSLIVDNNHAVLRLMYVDAVSGWILK